MFPISQSLWTLYRRHGDSWPQQDVGVYGVPAKKRGWAGGGRRRESKMVNAEGNWLFMQANWCHSISNTKETITYNTVQLFLSFYAESSLICPIESMTSMLKQQWHFFTLHFELIYSSQSGNVFIQVIHRLWENGRHISLLSSPGSTWLFGNTNEQEIPLLYVREVKDGNLL